MPSPDISCKSKFQILKMEGKNQKLQFQTGNYDSKVELTKPNRLKYQQKAGKMTVDQPFPMKNAQSNRRSNLAFDFCKSKFHPCDEDMDGSDGAMFFTFSAAEV